MHMEFFFHLMNINDIGIHLFIKIERKRETRREKEREKEREERGRKGRERERERERIIPIIKIYIMRQKFNKSNLKNLS